jgi:hypothetical protein
MHPHHDPSWCARLHAHRAPAADGVPAAASRPPAPETEGPPAAGRGETLAHGSPYRRREVPDTHTCECCGTVMYDHHCKIVCPNCGYKRDCSDP